MSGQQRFTYGYIGQAITTTPQTAEEHVRHAMAYGERHHKRVLPKFINAANQFQDDAAFMREFSVTRAAQAFSQTDIAEKKSDLKRVEVLFELALKAGPDNPLTLFEMARFYFEKSDISSNENRSEDRYLAAMIMHRLITVKKWRYIPLSGRQARRYLSVTGRKHQGANGVLS